MSIIAGIDYSLTSPAICVHKGSEWSIDNCTFYYMSHKKQWISVTGQFIGEIYEKFDCDAHRYDNISKWSSKILKENKVEKCFIEGYSYNSIGRVFQIAENGGLLKYKLWKENIPFQVFAPSEIKKFASGKGNANKEKMYKSFINETNIDIRKKLDIINKNIWNPISDIVDSYYIAKFGFIKKRN
jgi:Holliday junction resolvasome RuvABC endonuclease subunit